MREKSLNLLIVLIVFCAGVFGTYYVMSLNKTSGNVSGSSISKNVTITEEDSINESVQKVYDAVVVVTNYGSSGRASGYGSGFVYKKDDKKGYIMTNNHVVEGASSVKITLSSGEEVDAKVLGTDSYMDIAILSIDAGKVLDVAELGDSSKSKIGDTVFTVGTPVSTEYAGTVTKGIISGENREITVTNNNSKYMMEAIQIDASINPGNSGGPLVNINGEVIGVNSIKLVESSIEGMGFAIPIEVATSQVKSLEQGKTVERPLIGVSTYELSTAVLYGKSDIDTSKVKNGVLVTDVQEDSDADKAGIKVNDVIIKIDGVEVKSSAHLKFLLYKHSIGDTAKVTVYRDGKEKELTIKLEHKIGD